MKIIFILTFILVCGLAFCEQEDDEFLDELSDFEDPKRKSPCFKKCVRVYGCKKVFKFVTKCKLVKKCSFQNVKVRVCRKKCYYKLGKRLCKPFCRFVFRKKLVCKPKRECKRVKVPGKKCGYTVKCKRVCPKKY